MVTHLTHCFRVSPAIRDSQCYLPPDTGECIQALNSVKQADTRITQPGQMEGWVDLGDGYILRWFTCPKTVTHEATIQAGCMAQHANY